MVKDKHNSNLKNTILGILGGAILATNVAAQAQSVDIKTDNKSGSAKDEKEYFQVPLQPKSRYLLRTNPGTTPGVTTGPSPNSNLEVNSMVGFPKNDLRLNIKPYDSIDVKTKESKDTIKVKRAYQMPHANTTYVGSSIVGVAPTIMIAAGQEYNFDMNTLPGFNKNDFPLKVRAYNSFDAFVKDVQTRINYYEKHPGIVSKSRLERDKVALGQIKNIQAYRMTAEDLAIKDIAINSLADLILEFDESYNLAKEVHDMGYKNVLLPIQVYHEGAIIRGQKINAESIPIMLNIAELIAGKGEIRYGNVQDTSGTKKPCPPCPPTDATKTTPSDTLKHPVSKKGPQVYLGGGVELYPYARSTYFTSGVLTDKNEATAFIPQFVAGIKSGRFGIGGVFGYKDNIEHTIQEYYPNADNNGETLITKDIKHKMIQPGLDFLFFPQKNIGLNLRVQYNMLDIDTAGTVYQTVYNNMGHVKSILIPLEEESGRIEFLTINPNLELKLGPVGIYGGAKFAIKTPFTELPYGKTVSFNGGIKIYFGK